MVHFFIDAEMNFIVVTAVLHTSLDPKIWDMRGK